jgi:hypothetical protein
MLFLLMLLGLRARACMLPYDGTAVATDYKQTNITCPQPIIPVTLEHVPVPRPFQHLQRVQGMASASSENLYSS